MVDEANHTPEHTFVCGACGASTNDVEDGHPLCVTGEADHLVPPKRGFPHPEWEAANAGHPYLAKLEQLRPVAQAATSRRGR